jgi:hypothetical protein
MTLQVSVVIRVANPDLNIWSGFRKADLYFSKPGYRFSGPQLFEPKIKLKILNHDLLPAVFYNIFFPWPQNGEVGKYGSGYLIQMCGSGSVRNVCGSGALEANSIPKLW